MDPGNHAMRLRRNAPEPARFGLEDANGPLNITGYSLKLDVRLYPGQPGAPLLSLSTGDGTIVITDPVGGFILVDWPRIISSIRALPSYAEAGNPSAPRVDTFAYDLLLIAPGGSAQAILEGSVPVSFGVTIP